MIEKRTVTKEVEEVANVLCDLCGESCERGEWKEGLKSFEFATLKASFGYFSNFDCLRFELQLCEACTMDIFTRRKRKENEALIPEELFAL